MQTREEIRYHEGLTELLQLKRSMLRTVWRYCLIGLVVGVVIAVSVTLINSIGWADLCDFVRAALH